MRGIAGIVGVSLIIPAYNAESTLAECLEACLNQTHVPDEILVVDDGSGDATRAIAARYPVTLLSQENRGPAAARNLGARHAACDILAFTDSDCVPDPDWIARLVGGFTDERTVGVGGSYGIRNDSSLLARLVHEEIVMRHGRLAGEVDFLGSFNVAYRRPAFDAAGGFDESFARASGEDNDLAYRLQDAGGVLRFVPDACVAHYHPARLAPYLRTQMRHGYWRMRLYAKHPRRSGGDDYAGLGELLGPPMVLALGLGVVALAAVPSATVAGMLLVLTAAYLFATARLTRGMIARVGLGAGMAYRGMAMLRDAARGVGLIGGVWTFMLLRRGTT